MKLKIKVIIIIFIALTFSSNSFAFTQKEEDAFLEAIKKSQTASVKKALEKGISPNTADEEGNSALMYAVRYKSKAITELLINKGADVNFKNANEETVLMVQILFIKNAAPRKTDIAIAEILLANGANIDEKDGKEQTALFYAVKMNLPEFVELFIKYNTNIEIYDEEGDIPLDYAKRNKNEKIIKLLENAMANVESKPTQEPTKSIHSIEEIWDFLNAARIGNIKKIQKYAKTKMDPNIAFDNSYKKIPAGFTVLMLASKNGHKEIVTYLLKSHVLINAKNRFDDDRTAFYYAKKNGHHEIAAILKNAGARDTVKEEEEEKKRPSNFTAELGISATMGYLENPENETLIELAKYSTLRVGAHFDLLYTPHRFFGTGVEIGFYWMGVPLKIDGFGIRIDMYDIPIRAVFRIGVGPFCLQPYCGMILSTMKLSGSLSSSSKDLRLLAINNPFNAEIGGRLLIGGRVNFYVEAAYVHGIIMSYPRAGVGITVKFCGP